jgi:hypothetical protein
MISKNLKRVFRAGKYRFCRRTSPPGTDGLEDVLIVNPKKLKAVCVISGRRLWKTMGLTIDIQGKEIVAV